MRTIAEKSKQPDFLCPSYDILVKSDHPYRKIADVIDFATLCRPLESLYAECGRPGYSVVSGVKMLLLQWVEDLSDRELERFMQDSIAAKYFCGFNLCDRTPDHSTFGKLRDRIGTEGIADLFNQVGHSLKRSGYIAQCFTFVDASHIVTKGALWKERDRALAAQEEALTNDNVEKYASDSEARYGCKGNNKYWFGYKRHAAVDMKHGFISKVAATPANVTDAKGLKHVCPKQGAVVADKGYCVKPAQQAIKANGCHDLTIKNRNMKNKNKDKDRFISRLRSPYEGVFAHMNHRARYQGVKKVQYQCFMEALVFNIKRLVTINAPPLPLIDTG